MRTFDSSGVAVLVGSPSADQTVADRLTGAKSASSAARLDPSTLGRLDVRRSTLASRVNVIERIFILVPSCTAAFWVNDLIALALQTILHRAGVSIPGQFSIVVNDNIEAAERTPIPNFPANFVARRST